MKLAYLMSALGWELQRLQTHTYKYCYWSREMPVTPYQYQSKVYLVYMCSWGLGDWTIFFICSLLSRTARERQGVLHRGKPISNQLKTSPPPTSPLPASSPGLPSRWQRSPKTCSAKSHFWMARTTPVWWKWVKFPNYKPFSFHKN